MNSCLTGWVLWVGIVKNSMSYAPPHGLSEAPEAVTVMPRAEYELYVSGAGSLWLTWIPGPLNDVIFVCYGLM